VGNEENAAMQVARNESLFLRWIFFLPKS